MDPLTLVAGAVVVGSALLGIGYAIHHFSADQRAKRALKAAPRVTVAQVTDGIHAKLVGTLGFAGDSLEAPISGRRCAYYRVEVEEKKSSDKHSYWKPLFETTEYIAAFYLQDDSGRALVQLSAPKVALTMDERQSSGFLNDATPRLEALLRAHGESSSGWFFNRSLRYKEGTLEEGEQVAIYGLCRLEPDPDPNAQRSGGYRETAMQVRLVDPEQGEMLISDDPKVVQA